MASGCILGECPVCGEWVWEDEVSISGPIMHERCYGRHLSKEKRIEKLKSLIVALDEEDEE